MGKVGFWRLRVIKPTGNAPAIGGTDGQPADIEQVSGAVTEVGTLVDDLVESRKNIIGELDLGHGHRALGRQTIGKANNALLHQGRVEAALASILLLQVAGGTENPTKNSYIH